MAAAVRVRGSSAGATMVAPSSPASPPLPSRASNTGGAGGGNGTALALAAAAAGAAVAAAAPSGSSTTAVALTAAVPPAPSEAPPPPPPPSSAAPPVAGWLWKKGETPLGIALSNPWKRRWVVLQDGSFSYFERREDAEAGGPPIKGNIVSVVGCMVGSGRAGGETSSRRGGGEAAAGGGDAATRFWISPLASMSSHRVWEFRAEELPSSGAVPAAATGDGATAARDAWIRGFVAHGCVALSSCASTLAAASAPAAAPPAPSSPVLPALPPPAAAAVLEAPGTALAAAAAMLQASSPVLAAAATPAGAAAAAAASSCGSPPLPAGSGTGAPPCMSGFLTIAVTVCLATPSTPAKASAAATPLKPPAPTPPSAVHRWVVMKEGKLTWFIPPHARDAGAATDEASAVPLKGAQVWRIGDAGFGLAGPGVTCGGGAARITVTATVDAGGVVGDWVAMCVKGGAVLGPPPMADASASTSAPRLSTTAGGAVTAASSAPRPSTTTPTVPAATPVQRPTAAPRMGSPPAPGHEHDPDDPCSRCLIACCTPLCRGTDRMCRACCAACQCRTCTGNTAQTLGVLGGVCCFFCSFLK